MENSYDSNLPVWRSDIRESLTWPQSKQARAGATYDILTPPDGEFADSEEHDHRLSDEGNDFGSSATLHELRLNALGPLFITALYAYTVFGYLLRPSTNDIVPSRLVDPKVLFYTWIILSIFLLDWAKSGLAGFEAAALMKPRLAPAKAMQLMWHLDRGWGSLSGWWKAAGTIYAYVVETFGRGQRRAAARRWRGPGVLWWYLALGSLLFYVAVPLAGISIDPKDSRKLGKRQIVVLGVNETTFDVRNNRVVQGLASNSWRTGRPRTPQAPAIFYAPEGTKNTSATFYEDFIQNVYTYDVLGHDVPNRTVTFFSGPSVAEPAHGKTWGLLSSVSCFGSSLGNMELIFNVTGPNNWTSLYSSVSAATYQTFSANYTTSEMYSLTSAGILPVFSFADNAYGINFQYVIAADTDGWLHYGADWAPGSGEYSNIKLYPLPNKGSFEIVMWQSIYDGFEPDDGFRNMTANPLVALFENGTSLCYGVRCTVESDVGYADLNAVDRTYSNFQQQAASSGAASLNAVSILPIYQWPGVAGIQSIVFRALSTVSMGYLGAPSCLPSSDPTCNAFYGANLATGGVPRVEEITRDGTGYSLHQPSITPERMTLAMYKIFGEAAAAMMAEGPANFTGGLQGLDPANDLVPGKVPWQLVLALLCLWCAITVIPQLWTFDEPRWSSTLEAFEVFRFGAEWKNAVQLFKSNDFRENDVLLDLPGMIGDMMPGADIGFVGLSRIFADAKRRYTNTSDEKR
ncbi:hypothetical protein LTR70_008562 [Exophiala xenobiotica]|nr:hypothetical protein LTR70_008562 [Exophiala xenobiotica]